MCGFLAEYSLQAEGILSPKAFEQLLALSKERGPDSQGYWSNGAGVQLGFNRLAILDVSPAGGQPMHSPSGRYTLVFNGELYNHMALREQLSEVSFQGHSDTATLVGCLDAWGIEATVQVLNGMFAMVIYDHASKAISLVRDFAGVKPLFYGWNGHTLVAASQYDQVIAHPIYAKQAIVPEVLKLYMEQHFMPAPYGLYEQTYQVKPGELVRISAHGQQDVWRYWELPKASQPIYHTLETALPYVNDLLDQSVHRQLLSDVPLGAFLSGGVDSGLICSSLERRHGDAQVFTIGSDSTVHDESARAQAMAEALELQQYLQHLTAQELLEHWDAAMDCLHEPMADFSVLPTYMVSKLAKNQVTVALSGDGGDELFFGYERFWSVGKNISFQHYPNLLRKALYGIDKYRTGNQRVNAVLLASQQGDAHKGLHSRFRKEWLYAIAPHLETVSLPETYDTYQYPNSRSPQELLDHMRYAEFYGMLQKTLRKVDLASMAHGLEVRVPFLDKEFIEGSLEVSPLLSYGEVQRKDVLRQLWGQRFPTLPKDPSKKGFSVPLGAWLREDLGPMFQERLLDADLGRFGFEHGVVARMLKAHEQREGDFKWPLFTLYALLKWED